MAQAIALKAEERQGTGTGVARALRREGKIPGIIYGGKNEPQPIAVDLKAVNAEIQKPGFFSRVYSVEIDKTKDIKDLDIEIPVLTNRIQRDHKDLSLLNPDAFEFKKSPIKIFTPEQHKNISA